MSFLSLAGGAAGAFLPKASTRSARLVDRAGAWNAVAQAARRSTRRLRAIAKDLQQVEAMGMRWHQHLFCEVAKAIMGRLQPMLQLVYTLAGDATLHDSTLLHAVTAVRPGAARYSLILFFFRRAPR